jgi:hypothetical protein
MYHYTRVRLFDLHHPVDYELTHMEEYKWCVETFKLPTDLREWYTNAGWNYIEYNFRDPAHALMFTLRWVK